MIFYTFNTPFKNTKTKQMAQLKRRQFLKNTIVSGLGASLMAPELQAKESLDQQSVEPETRYAPQSGKSKRVIVAGAGIAGLLCV